MKVILIGLTAVTALSLGLTAIPRKSSAHGFGLGTADSKACSTCMQGTTSASVDWLKLTAGVTYHFADMQLSPGVNPNWETEYGTISSTGDYIAPSYMPPMGLDRISYVAADGSNAMVTIRLVANPNLPDSGYPRYLQRTNIVLQSFPAGGANPVYAYNLIGGAAQTVLATGDINTIAGNAPIPVLEPNDTYDGPVAVVDCVAIDVVSATPLSQRLSVPSGAVQTESVNAVGSLTVTAPGAGVTPVPLPIPAKCTPVPVNPWPIRDNKNCTLPGGLHRVYGPWGKPVRKKVKNQDVTIEMTVDLALQILERYGISVKDGVKYPGNRTILEWTKSRKNDLYVCRNGVWTFQRTEICTSTAAGESTSPVWIAFVDGYPSDGGPGPWGPESCQ